jgi:ribosomal protein L16 Arg81 hydroxylase
MYNDKDVYSASDYPEYHKSQSSLLNNISAMEVILNPGDAIFIPITWWHRVESLDVSISLSFIDFLYGLSFF